MDQSSVEASTGSTESDMSPIVVSSLQGVLNVGLAVHFNARVREREDDYSNCEDFGSYDYEKIILA